MWAECGEDPAVPGGPRVGRPRSASGAGVQGRQREGRAPLPCRSASARGCAAGHSPTGVRDCRGSEPGARGVC